MTVRLTTGGEKSVEELEAQAADWAAKLDAAPDQHHAGLDEWLAQSRKHPGALLRAQAILAAFAPPLEELADRQESVERSQSTSRSTRFWKRPLVLGGAGAAIAASLAAFLLIGLPSESYETELGEVRSVALNDGSSVSIDAKSRIDIDFEPKSRDVHLRSGKVLFRATHDAERPFRVLLDGVVITDIGTAFQVTRDEANQEVEVLVTEGAVRVDSPAGRADLTAGQRARFSQVSLRRIQAAPERISAADIDRSLAWRNGQLELNGETLASAIAEINRHSRLQLRVDGKDLAQEKLFGSFRMDDAAGFARTVAAGLDVDARTEADGIVITAAKK